MKADFFYLDINHRRDVTLTTLMSIYFHGPIVLSKNISISISSNDISSLRWKLRGRLTEAGDHYNQLANDLVGLTAVWTHKSARKPSTCELEFTAIERCRKSAVYPSEKQTAKGRWLKQT